MATIVGGGVLDAPRVSSPSRVMYRAAQPSGRRDRLRWRKGTREGFIPPLQTKKQEPLRTGRLLLYG